MKNNIARFTSLLVATSGLALSLPAQASDSLQKLLIDDATPYIDVRYRFENVDQDGIAKDANASTVRTQLGYKTGQLHGFSGVVELENTAELGGETYNDTVNGKTTYPIVADPDGTEINQAYIEYKGIPDTTVKFGRFGAQLDNQRHIGTVPWRQNEQTYDAVAVMNHSIEDTMLMYGYVSNVNRVNGDDHPFGDLDTKTHLFNASYDGFSFGKLSAYAYLLDLDDAVLSSLDTSTYGVRFTGSTAVSDDTHLLYSAEYARQSDRKDNTADYSVDYYLIEGGVKYSGLTAKLGYEVLGSDNSGTSSFQTALGTNHGFNGWADKFIGGIPGTGLEDLYASIGYKVSSSDSTFDGLTLMAAYHDFDAESGGADYGDEINAKISKDFMDHYNVTLKYADYDADSWATDTRKMWFVLGAKF